MKTQQPIYNLDDVRYFLAQNDCGLWTGNIYDRKTGKTRQAKVEECSNLYIQTFEMITDDKEWKDFAISEFNFAQIAYDHLNKAAGQKSRIGTNFSNNWCKYLLEQYGVEYANMLTDWCEENIARIKTEIQALPENEKRRYEPVINSYKNLQELALTKIDEANANVTA